MPIADLTFSATFADTAAFPTGAHPGRTELQLLHDETKGHINTVVKPAITALQGPPKARVYNSASQSIPNGINTALAFDTERYDTDTMHDAAVNNSRLTCTTPGLYSIFGNIEMANNATGLRSISIRLNGVTTIAKVQKLGAGGYEVREQVYTQYQLAAGDYVELVVYQDSGGALNVVAAPNYSPEFGMTRLGD